MALLMKLLEQIERDETGATAIEYGLLAALISIAAITAMGSLGNALVNTYTMMTNDMVNAQNGQL